MNKRLNPLAYTVLSIGLIAGMILFGGPVVAGLLILFIVLSRPAVRKFIEPLLYEQSDPDAQTAQANGKKSNTLSEDHGLITAVFSTMKEGALVVDESGCVRIANEAIRQMLKMPAVLTNDHYIKLIQHPEVVKQISRTLETGGSSHAEIMLTTEPTKVCQSSAIAFVTAGETGVILVLHDVSSFHPAWQIRQDFIANVSHELRTPLTAIRGSVDALLDETDVATQQKFIEIISRHTTRMERLVADLLKLASLDSGKEQIQYAPCVTASIFSNVEIELTPLLQTKEQRLETQIQPSAENIIVDPVKLHDSLKNLVENAAHYSPSGSAIGLSAQVGEEGLSVVLQVSDRGPGIPAGDLLRVFERFYRVEQSRARNPGGTGLGLAIVKHLVGLHNGTVEAKHRPGGGAVFSIILPRLSAETDSDTRRLSE